MTYIPQASFQFYGNQYLGPTWLRERDHSTITVPISGVTPPNYDNPNGPFYEQGESLANLVPNYSIKHPYFPSVWTDRLDEDLFDTKVGFTFWRRQLLSVDERPASPWDNTVNEIYHHLPHFDRELHLTAFLSCIAFKDNSQQDCQDTLADPKRRICGAKYIRHGGGLGATVPRHGEGFGSMDYLEWSVNEGALYDLDLEDAMSCYGRRSPYDIYEWKETFEARSRSKNHTALWNATKDLYYMSNQGNNNMTRDNLATNLWPNWLHARDNAFKIMVKKAEVDGRDTFNFQEDTRTVGRLRAISVVSEPRFLRMNGFDPTTSPLVFNSVLREYLSPRWSFQLSLLIPAEDTTLVKDGYVVVKPILQSRDSNGPSGCDSPMMTDAIAFAQPVAGITNETEITFNFSFYEELTPKRIKLLRDWLNLTTIGSHRKSTDSGRLLNLKNELCFYNNKFSHSGTNLGHLRMESTIVEWLVIFFLVVNPIVMLPTGVGLAMGVHFVQMKKLRLKICRENLRHSRGAIEDRLSILGKVLSSDEETEDDTPVAETVTES